MCKNVCEFIHTWLLLDVFEKSIKTVGLLHLIDGLQDFHQVFGSITATVKGEMMSLICLNNRK